MAPRVLAARWWLAAAVVAALTTAAWFGTGLVARQRLGASVPPQQDLGALPAAVRDAVVAADQLARSTPGPRTIGALGRAYHAAQVGDGALAAYRAAESLAPEDWTWTYLRGLLLEERGAPEATNAFRRVTEAAPETGHAWFRLAEAEFKAGRLDEARYAYARAAAAPEAAAFRPDGVTTRRTWPLGAHASVGLARIELERGDPDAARLRLEDLVTRHPAFAAAQGLLRQLRRGPADAGGSDLPPADPVLDALVASSHRSDRLLEHAGLAARASDHGWREYLARRALAFNPEDLNVLMEMASMLQATGRPAEALEHLRHHEALAPGDHHGLVQQGRVLAELGRLGEAEAVLVRATAGGDAAAEYTLGTVLDRQGRWDEARRHYERAIAIDPFHARAMNSFAVGLDRRGNSLTALVWFRKALAIAPDTAEFHVNHGSALIQARRFDEAVRALETAIRLEPGDADAHNNLGIALASRGDLPGAQGAFTRALEVDPRHADGRRNLDRVSATVRHSVP